MSDEPDPIRVGEQVAAYENRGFRLVGTVMDITNGGRQVRVDWRAGGNSWVLRADVRRLDPSLEAPPDIPKKANWYDRINAWTTAVLARLFRFIASQLERALEAIGARIYAVAARHKRLTLALASLALLGGCLAVSRALPEEKHPCEERYRTQAAISWCLEKSQDLP